MKASKIKKLLELGNVLLETKDDIKNKEFNSILNDFLSDLKEIANEDWSGRFSLSSENYVKQFAEREANLLGILENTYDSIWLLDSNYRLVFANRAFKRDYENSFGVKLKKGHTIVDLLPIELRSLWMERYRRVLEKGENFVVQDEIPTDIGTQYVEIWFYPIYSGNKITGATFYGRNITEKVVSELEIRKSEEKYRLITEFSSDVIWMFNITQNKFEYISPAVKRLRGISVEEAMQEKIEDTLAEEFIPILNKKISDGYKDYLKDPENPVFSTEVAKQKHKDGHYIWVEFSTRFRTASNGDVEVVGISRNIDERKKHEESQKTYSIELEMINEELKYSKSVIEANLTQKSALIEELRNVNATKDKFFSIIAHDLRNPMGNFKQLTEILSESYFEMDTGEKIEFIEVMKQSSSNLYALLENLLEWSRTQRGLISFNPEVLDLYGIVNITLNLLSINAGKKLINIESSIEYDSKVCADANLLTTIIRNLTTNAIKFTDTGGCVEVGISKEYSDDNFLAIYVKDNGIGMDKSTIRKLFRIDQNTTNIGTSGEKGTGLGLILCKEFVSKHGGEIWVESELGVGTTFYFTIPILKEKYDG